MASLLCAAWAGVAAAATLELLPGGRAEGVEERSFAGHTRYRTAAHDGAMALGAEAVGSASGLYWRRDVALERWPVLRWRWQATALPGAADERRKDGDDFAARVYVVAADPVLFWRSRAISYVWAESAAPGEAWPNPYTDTVMVVVLRSGRSRAAGWVEERRDVAADFRRYFGEAPERVNAVAVMTDADQTGRRAAAWYEGLRFESR